MKSMTDHDLLVKEFGTIWIWSMISHSSGGLQGRTIVIRARESMVVIAVKITSRSNYVSSICICFVATNNTHPKLRGLRGWLMSQSGALSGRPAASVTSNLKY